MNCHLPKITAIPERTNSSFESGSLPIRVVRKSLSTVRIWETLATEFFGRPVRRAERETFPTPGPTSDWWSMERRPQWQCGCDLTRQTGRLAPGDGSQEPTRRGRVDLPTKSRLAKLPLATLKSATCRGRNERVRRFTHFSTGLIHGLGHLFRGVAGQVLP